VVKSRRDRPGRAAERGACMCLFNQCNQFVRWRKSVKGNTSVAGAGVQCQRSLVCASTSASAGA
jgi:hypothetical protein